MINGVRERYMDGSLLASYAGLQCIGLNIQFVQPLIPPPNTISELRTEKEK